MTKDYDKFCQQAFDEFMANPLWAGRYNNAPEGAKRFFKAEFAYSYSATHGGEFKEQTHEDLQKAKAQLKRDDIAYLHSVLKGGMSQAFLSNLVKERTEAGYDWDADAYPDKAPKAGAK